MLTRNRQRSTNAMQRFLSLWRNRDYMLLWSGQTISEIGTNVSQIAFPLLVLALTGKPVQAGVAGALRALPYFLLGLPIGALVDRWDRKLVMILCDSGRVLSLGSIPVALTLGHLTVLQLYINAALEGTLYVFFDLAETACFPRVVPQTLLPTATAQQAATGGFAALIGPALGGLLYSLKTLFPFLVDAVSYLISAISLCFIRTTFQAERASEQRALHLAIGEGLRWLWGQPLLRSLAVLTGLVNLVFPDSSMLVVIVLAGKQGATPGAIGLIFACASVGYIVGSLLSERLVHSMRFGRLVSVTCWLFALLWSAYLLSTQVLALLIITTLISCVDPIYDVAQFSRRAALIPDELQGRVNSAYRLIALGTPPLGLVLAGALLQYTGILATILVFAASLLALALLATCNKAIRHAGEEGPAA